MRKRVHLLLFASATALVASLSGCATAGTDAVACDGLNRAVEKWTTAIEPGLTGTSMDSLKSTAASAEQYLDEMREVEATEELASLRDELVDILDRWHSAVEQTTDGTGLESFTGDVAGVQVDLQHFCDATL
jgi:hypothetical protein